MKFLLPAFMQQSKPQAVGIEVCKSHVNRNAIFLMRHFYCNTFHLWLGERS